MSYSWHHLLLYKNHLEFTSANILHFVNYIYIKRWSLSSEFWFCQFWYCFRYNTYLYNFLMNSFTWFSLCHITCHHRYCSLLHLILLCIHRTCAKLSKTYQTNMKFIVHPIKIYYMGIYLSIRLPLIWVGLDYLCFRLRGLLK